MPRTLTDEESTELFAEMSDPDYLSLTSLRKHKKHLEDLLATVKSQLSEARRWESIAWNKEAEAAAMRAEFAALMSESTGVAGLHLNGELAGWDWLIDHGWFQHLSSRNLSEVPDWTLENLTQFVLQQGAEIRHCEDCAMESRCKSVNFWCRPFRLLAEELGAEVKQKEAEPNV